MQKALIYILLVSFFTACTTDTAPEQSTTSKKDLKEILPGVWESVSIKVTMNTADNSDTSRLFEVPEENWERMLGIKPIRTFYEVDNKYRTEYRNRDSITNLKRGMWNVFGDTLMLIEPDVTYQYTVKIQDSGLAEFRSILDWDGDGQEDDEYIGIQRYISKSTLLE